MNFNEYNKTKQLVLNILKKHPGLTAGQIWSKIAQIRSKSASEYREIKRILFEEDQSVRLLLARMEEDGWVSHSIRHKSILKEWKPLA